MVAASGQNVCANSSADGGRAHDGTSFDVFSYIRLVNLKHVGNASSGRRIALFIRSISLLTTKFIVCSQFGEAKVDWASPPRRRVTAITT